jgi:hypothetical protein
MKGSVREGGIRGRDVFSSHALGGSDRVRGKLNQ